VIYKQTNARRNRLAGCKNGVQFHRRTLIFRQKMNKPATGQILRNVPKRLPGYAFTRKCPRVQNGSVSAGKGASYAQFELAAIALESPQIIQVMPTGEAETIMPEEILK
jgi:hypothetical protein